MAFPESRIPNPESSKKTLYLIDGSGFIFRAYHALPPLTSPTGTPVGAVLGFVNMMTKLIETHPADYIAVVFDVARKTFRNDLYADYKAHRPPPPDDLIPQFALVRDAARALNLQILEQENLEADDLIGCYAKAAHEQGIDTVIVSSDKDMMQCIGDGVSMYDAMKQKPIGPAEVMEKFGVTPDKVIDVLALIGDSSDNVPGVPSIGPKTAAELINQYGDLETLLSRVSEIKQPKRREVLTQHADDARLSKQLVTLKCDIPLPQPLEALASKPIDPQTILNFAALHGFKSLTARLQQKFSGTAPAPIAPTAAAVPKPSTPAVVASAPVKNYSILRSEAELADWIARAKHAGAVAFDVETTGLNPMQAELVGFSLSVTPGIACYVPLAHVTQTSAPAQGNMFGDEDKKETLIKKCAEGQIAFDRAVQLLKPLLEDESVLKIGHNIKYDAMIMRRYDAYITPVACTMLQAYALHAGEHGMGMDELSERYLGYKPISYDEVTGTGRARVRFDEVDIAKAGEYAAEDADITLRLYEFFKPQLFAEKLLTLYETIERPLIDVLADMESRGIKIDPKQLATLSADFGARMKDYEQEIYKLAGHEFNIGSPKQLGEVLFDKLQLEGGKKSAKSGAYGTDSGVLEELAEQGHPLPAKVLEWRQLAKLKSTYSDSLTEQIDPKTGRVHTCFAMAVASTGRLSSTDPNLQNIPIRSVEGRKIRQAFIAEPGYKLLSADYSQIELRLLAHIADIGPLKEAFLAGRDIHAITASQIFGVSPDAVNDDLRRKAKTINFGIIYGMGAHGLATRLGIGRSEAGAYIESYFQQYPGIRDYMETTKEFARSHGYVATLYGRRCHLPGINDKGARRAFSERQAINAPLQGTAADIIKRAMISVHRTLVASPYDARMLLQVHDELVFEIIEKDTEAATKVIKHEMENAAHLSVPLIVDTGLGNHWDEAH